MISFPDVGKLGGGGSRDRVRKKWSGAGCCRVECSNGGGGVNAGGLVSVGGGERAEGCDS